MSLLWISDPSSKLKAFESRNNYLFPITSCETDKDIYKPLDMLSKYSNPNTNENELLR